MISVVIQSNTTVTVTRSPGVFARLFLGRQETTRTAFDPGYLQWVWLDDNTYVEPDVDAAIDRAFIQRAVRTKFLESVWR